MTYSLIPFRRRRFRGKGRKKRRSKRGRLKRNSNARRGRPHRSFTVWDVGCALCRHEKRWTEDQFYPLMIGKEGDVKGRMELGKGSHVM